MRFALDLKTRYELLCHCFSSFGCLGSYRVSMIAFAKALESMRVFALRVMDKSQQSCTRSDPA